MREPSPFHNRLRAPNDGLVFLKTDDPAGRVQEAQCQGRGDGVDDEDEEQNRSGKEEGEELRLRPKPPLNRRLAWKKGREAGHQPASPSAHVCAAAAAWISARIVCH